MMTIFKILKISWKMDTLRSAMNWLKNKCLTQNKKLSNHAGEIGRC